MITPRAAILAVLISTPLFAAEIGITFSGVLTAEGKTRLALTDTARKTTTWVEPGGVFNGYTVARYDPKEEAVFLKKGGQETRLGLATSKTPDAPSTPAAPATASLSADATNIAIRSNLRQLTSAARQYQLERGVNTVAYTDLVGPGKMIRELKPVAGENYSTLTFGPNVTGVSVTTANGATIMLDVPPTGAAAVGPAAQPQGLPAPATTAATAAAPTPAGSVLPQPAPRALAPPTSTAPVSAAGAAIDPGAQQASGPTPPPAASDRQPMGPNYTIQGGDTWQKISDSTGVPVAQLKQLNPGIPDTTTLPAGQSVRVR